MKKINECFEDMQDITSYLKGENVNEGLKDVLKTIKEKFKKVFQYLKSFVVKVGSYILPVSDSGLIIPAISPLTAGAAYADGNINTNSTFVKMDKEGAKITGCKTKFEDALNLYGKGNSISYWMQMISENEEDKTEFNAILENYINEHADDVMSEELINEVKLHTEDPEAEYNIIKDDAGLQEMITMCVKNKRLARLLIWGAPGIGKTAILMNVISSLKKDFPDIRLIVKTLSNETPDNFTLPDYVEDMQDEDFEKLAKDLNKEESVIRKLYKLIGGRKSVDVPKTWLPVYKPTGDKEVDAYLDAKCGDGLLFIDELSRATPQVLNVMLPLINEGMFNGYKLGSGWTIVCASNRLSDDAGQTEIGNALANRFLQVHYEPTVDNWREWADKQNFISPLLLQWLSLPEKETMSGGKFYYMDPNEDSSRIADTTLMCTPRSWTNAMRLLAGFHHTGTLEGFKIFDIPQHIIKKALNSAVPKTAVNAFMSFLEVIEEVGNFDEAVYDVWQNGGKNFKLNKKSLNKITLPLAQLICTAHADKLPSQKEWENMCDWLVDQNSDQLASYVLNVFGNVFVANVPKELVGQFYLAQQRIKKFGADNPKLASYKNALSPALSKWGIEFEDIPDYSVGIQTLIKKYGESFNSAVVGAHENALG